MKLENVEIPDDDINVEDIMRRIRQNIVRRKEEKESRAADQSSRGYEGRQESYVLGAAAQRELEYLNSNWDIQNNSYFVSSHRPVAGKALVKGRELVHGEVRRYVDPMIGKQKEFNGCVVRFLNEVTKDAADIYSGIRMLKRYIDQVRNEGQAQIDEKQAQNNLSVEAAMNVDMENSARLAGILENRNAKSKGISTASSAEQDSGINYFLFEERFRGSQADIKDRQRAFLKYFKWSNNIVDIGCGRGEFLELLQEQGIDGKGVDIDEDMVNFCKSNGFDVVQMDAISYLNALKDRSLGGILIDQVVEHLEPDYLIRLIRLCYKKLIYGGSIVVETVNPLSFFSFANFYIDMSHKRPVHPETLTFLLEAEGFIEIERLFFALLPADQRLIGRDIDPSANEKEKSDIETYNRNIDKLNNILFGHQDYAIVGRK